MAKARYLSSMGSFPLRLRGDKAPELEGLRTRPADTKQARLGITALRSKGPKRIHPGRFKRAVFRALGLPQEDEVKKAPAPPKPGGKSKSKPKGGKRKKGRRNAIPKSKVRENRRQELEWKLNRARAWQAQATDLDAAQHQELQQQIEAMEASLEALKQPAPTPKKGREPGGSH